MTLVDWLVIAGYFGVLAAVVVGTLRRKKIESGEDLFLGGRSVGWLGLGFVLGMSKLTVNTLCAGSGGLFGAIAKFPDFYFSGVLLVTCFLIVTLASLTAAAPDEKRLSSLTFATLGDDFRRENRASWNWVDVLASVLVLAVVIACYAYFWNWLG